MTRINAKKWKVLINNLKALSNYRAKKVVLDNKPSFIWIEPTNHCNLKCIMCPTGQDLLGMEKGFMEYGVYKKIIDEIKNHTSSIMLEISGESLLYPQVYEMINYAQNNGIRPMLNTNATLLNESATHSLLDSGIQHINFGFDGFNKEMYEQIRVGANFEKTLENILYFLREKKRRKQRMPYSVLTVLLLNVGRYTEKEKTYFLEKLAGLVDEIRLREAFSWGNKFKDTDKFSYFKNENTYWPCGRLWSTLAIAWNGEVIPCTYDVSHEYVLGNIRKDRILDIWNCKRMINLRESMLDKTYLNLFAQCEDCMMLHTDAVLSIPAGLRGAISDSITNIGGFSLEKYILRLTNMITGGGFTTKNIG